MTNGIQQYTKLGRRLALLATNVLDREELPAGEVLRR